MTLDYKNQIVDGHNTPQAQEVHEQLVRLFENELFSQSERLRDFLSYIVGEVFDGRGDSIRGKTIAQDVYGREPTEGGDPENIVRVHARQLRHALSVYYETAGVSDPIRIYLDSGGYCPRFEFNVAEQKKTSKRRLATIAVAIAAFVIGGLSGGFVFHSVYNSQSSAEPITLAANVDPMEQIERQAVLEKSAISLQAKNLAEQARGMIFPIFDRPRQEMVHTVFLQVIETDPGYFGGYAGAAQAMATISIISPPGAQKEDAISQADLLVRQAVDLEPVNAWTQSALAWVELSKGNYDDAFELSDRAKKIAPNDGHVMDFHGAVSLFSGRFSEAIAAADRTTAKGGSNQRFANRNIYGAANFHLGNFEQTIVGFEDAVSFGDPLSAPSLAYQAAALQNLGRSDEAKRKLSELHRSWPNAPLDVMFHGIYQDPVHVDELLSPLLELGWKPKTREN